VTWHGLVIDIDEQKRLERKLEYLAITDSLTELYNRRYLMQRLLGTIAAIKRYGGCLSLACFDVDHFKQINDLYGHSAGDAVLQSLAATIKSRVRASDVVARTGGEEFVVLMPHTGRNSGLRLAENLRETIESQPLRLDNGERIFLTISAGVVAWCQGDQWPSDLLAACDRLLYAAKNFPYLLGLSKIITLCQVTTHLPELF